MAKTPKLSVSTAQSKANTVSARLDALVPNIASDLSPSLAYLPAATVEVSKDGTSAGSNDFGWTAPDINNGQPYTVQVECYGAGGGGGGGGAVSIAGGGGGGGGEYACEPLYPVVPGEVYSYYAGQGGVKGLSSKPLANGSVNGLPGFTGTATRFDSRGKGLTGGVVANGGQGGDQLGIGVSGRGGTGSGNSIHFDGGTGGTSSSGIQSDNPVLGFPSGLAHTYCWYRLDDAAGSTAAADFSSQRTQSTNLVKQAGAIVGPVSSQAAPLQTPFGPSANWWGGASPGETMGNCWEFAHNGTSGFIGGFQAGSFSYGANLTNFSVSAWIKGAVGASRASDWQDGTHTSSVIFTNRNLFVPSSPGLSLTLNYPPSGASQLNLGIVQSNGTSQTVTAAGPSAVDGNWHMITATCSTAGNVVLYIDGAAVQTTACTLSSVGGGTSIHIGYNGSTNAYGFKGFMSNVYFTSAPLTSAYVAAAFGSAAATGGSGGGASGGSAGTGNNGAAAVGTAGGAGGASAAASSSVNHGSGAGGAGGNQNVAGTVGTLTIPFAGGGGGAGTTTSAVPNEFQVTLSCSMSASYAGLDAPGGESGSLYTVSADPLASTSNPWYSAAAVKSPICYTGGAAAAPFKGTMNSLLTFPSLANVNGNQSGGAVSYLSNAAAWAIQKVYLTLTIESPSACNINIGGWNSNAIIAAVDSDTTLAAWGYGGVSSLVLDVPAGTPGRQVTFDLSGTSYAASMVSHAQSNGFSQNGQALQGVGLLLGTLTGSATYQGNIHGAWNADDAPDWNCIFHGADANNPGLSAQLTLTYTPASPTLVAAGNGAPGYIVISYLDPRGTPVATVLPQAETDTKGNALGAGFTASAPNYNVWNPSTSPPSLTLETFHKVITAGMSNSWAGVDDTNIPCGYQLLPGNLLFVSLYLLGTSKTGGANSTVFTLPVGWRPSRTWFAPMTSNESVTPTSNYIVQIGSNGILSVNNAPDTTARRYFLNTIFSLT